MKLKVCGLNNRENILQVLEQKPDYIGFIFYERSPRYIGNLDPDFVYSIKGPKKVGVFVNDSEIEILDCVARYGLDLVQLHGDESSEFCALISISVPVIKAFQVGDNFDFEAARTYENVCKYFLFDSKSSTYGGSGEVFDHKRMVGYSLEKPYFLSGGISLENMEKTKSLPAYALDVNSKFECSPGIKDIDKIKQIKSLLGPVQAGVKNVR